MCLISGQEKPIARLHPGIKGVDGTATADAALVSFNDDSFCSFDKNDDQNLNAPIGKEEAFNYTTALNYLLARDHRRRVKIGDAITVFWTERAQPIEGFMGMILDPRDETGDTADLRLFLESIRDGKNAAGFWRSRCALLYPRIVTQRLAALRPVLACQHRRGYQRKDRPALPGSRHRQK